MRIVHVCRQYRPGIGGLENFVEQLASQQVRAGHDVAVVTLDRIFHAPERPLEPHEYLAGIEIIRVPFFGSERYPIATGVLRHLRDAAIVHVHAIDFFFDFLALTRLIHRKPLVVTTHGGFFHTDFAKSLKLLWFKSITRFNCRAYRAVIACSTRDEESFARIAPDNIVRIENGVDIEKFRGLAGRDSKAILHFGRLAPNKAIDRILPWFARIRERDKAWTLTIAGKPDGVDPEVLREEAKRLGIADGVRLVLSPSDKQLAELIADASVFASASQYEGFGLAAVEAASAGLMPVLSRAEAFERTIERLGTGMLTDFQPTAVEAARFLAGWARWSERQDADNLDRAVAQFGWQQAGESYARLYEAILGEQQRQIGDISVSVSRRAEILANLDAAIAERQPLMVTFCNAHTVNTARTRPDFVRSLRSALILNDGVGLDIASRLLYGRSFPDNLNGTDLTPQILEHVKRPLRIFLLGSAPGTAERAAAELERRYPAHKIVGTQHGFFTKSSERALVERIRASDADLVLVGMGQPRQEKWAAENVAQLGIVVICVGAFIDFLAGNVARAPLWLRRIRCEWVFRLLLEPRRLAHRYLVGNFTFLAFIIRLRFGGLHRLQPSGARRKERLG